MAGYTRQSVADIIASAVIKAGPVNAEYNAIRDAFAFSGGHKHDGSSTEGAYVPLIADTDALNKVVIDTANNRISFYNEVSSTAVEQIRLEDGVLKPVTDDDVDLGAAGAEFKDLYIDGIGYIDSVVITGGTIDGTVIGGTTPAAITGTTITGTSLVGPVTGNITGDVTGNLTGNVTGDVTGDLTGDVTSTGTSSFATVNTTGNVAVGGTLAVTSTSAFTGAISAGSLTTTGNSTHATVDINGGAIDGTVIGAVSAAAGNFTTVSTSGQATLATADINGGTIDGAVIGGTSAQAITGTTITANTGFTGALTGNVTGNVTGNLTGNVTGNVTGDLTGNVTAATGTTTVNNLIVNGTVDFTSTALLNVSDPTTAQQAATKNYVDTNDALKLNLSGGTMSGDIAMGTNKVTGLGVPTLSTDAATKGYVDTEVANLVDAAPGTLDTLNELAAALGDDPNFSTTITTSIATKLPLAGGTMTGDITMGANAVTSTATPATADTLTRKGYVDTQDALKLDLAGGTMSGAIAMGTSKITGLGDPTAAQDAATKTYVDTADATKLNLSGGTMTGAIDMGANKITTTYTPTNNADLTTKTYVDGILGSATAAAASAAAAATSETNAATSETNAATSAAQAAASYDDFDDRYLGAKSSAPTVDNDGDALVTGALYWNTTSNELYIWDGSNWQQGSFTAGSLLANVVEDTTPQLGGALDTNGNNINFGDNVKAQFGAGNDIQIYHTGGTSFIDEVTTGQSLKIRADNLQLERHTGETFLTASNNGSVDVYYDNSKKLATTSTGIDVTGTVVADGLTVQSDYIDLYAADNARNLRITPAVTGTNHIFTSTLTGAGYDFRNNSQLLMKIDGFTNDISFYEDTGTTVKFRWDASTERLGLGTISPATSLDVNGGFNGSHATFSGQSGRGLVISTAVTTNNDDSVVYNAQTSTGAHVWQTNSSERMRITNSGDVGIGTSYPTGKLDVEDTTGSLSATKDITAEFFRADGTYNPRLQVRHSTSGTDLNHTYSSGASNLTFSNGGSERMRIDSSGNLLVGTTSGSDKVTVNGDVSATNFNSTSDATLKTNVETLSGSLDAVKAMRGVSFDWIDSDGSEIGVIAQEVEEVLPELVNTNDEGIKSVKYGNIVAVLIEAIKEQQEQIDELKAQLNS